MIKSQLPIPVSGLTSSLSVGLNDDGELDEIIHLLGGCLSGHIPTISDERRAEGEESNFAYDYMCPRISDLNFIFDPKNHTDPIRKGESMPRPRHRHASIAVNGFIWVLGGRDQNDFVINEIDIFDSIQGKWKTLETGLNEIQVLDPTQNDELGYEVSDQCVFESSGFIVMTGGFDSEYNALGHTIMIDPDASLEQNSLVYEIKSSLNTPRGSCGVASHANFAYIVGGFTDEDGFCEAMKSVEVYDLKKDIWTQMDNELMIGRANPGVFYYDSRIVAFGGENRGTFDIISEKCMDEYEAMDALSFEDNRMLPNRLAFPINANSIEVWELPDARPDDSVPWLTEKVNFLNDFVFLFHLRNSFILSLYNLCCSEYDE